MRDNLYVQGRRYSEAQLKRLLEIVSTVQCECPNHLAKLVMNLVAFEEYAKGCENRNEADAIIHEKLYRQTAAARLVMEEALAVLIEHENIEI